MARRARGRRGAITLNRDDVVSDDPRVQSLVKTLADRLDMNCALRQSDKTNVSRVRVLMDVIRLMAAENARLKAVVDGGGDADGRASL
jgi:hypothetical protein